MSDVFYEEEALGKAYDTRLLVLLWRYISPYRWQVVVTLLLVVPIFALELAPAWIIKTGLDYAFAPGATAQDAGALASWVFDPPLGLSTLAWLALLYLVVALLGMGLQFGHMVLMAVTGQSAMRDVRGAVFEKIQQLHMGFFDGYPVGRLVTRATNDVENVTEMFSAGVVALITDVFKMVGFALVLFYLNPKLGQSALFRNDPRIRVVSQPANDSTYKEVKFHMEHTPMSLS